MSRLGKQPIAIPDKTDVTVSGNIIRVKGPLGELERTFRPEIAVEVKDKTVTLSQKRPGRFAKTLWGSYASHLKNMIEGVNQAFSKTLIMEGVGYRWAVEGKKLVLNVGFSHPVSLAIPEDAQVVIEKNVLTIKGKNKETVGQFAANIRALKKPEPYKGKGIRYEGEVIRRKQGKKAV